MLATTKAMWACYRSQNRIFTFFVAILFLWPMFLGMFGLDFFSLVVNIILSVIVVALALVGLNVLHNETGCAKWKILSVFAIYTMLIAAFFVLVFKVLLPLFGSSVEPLLIKK